MLKKTFVLLNPALLCSLTSFVILALLGVFAILLGGAFVAAQETGWQGIVAAFSFLWQPEKGVYGILPMFCGSLALAVLATAIALPVSLGLVGFLWCEGNSQLFRPIAAVVRSFVRLMLGIPTVVYGFCAFVLLVPTMRFFFAGSGLGLLTTALLMTLLILPTMTLIMDNAIAQVMGEGQNLPMVAASLGLSQSRTFWLVALPARKNWIFVGMLLSFGRALGDTMLPLMLIGNAPIMPQGLMYGTRTLTTHISLLTATEINPQIELTLYLAGTLLLLTSTAVSLCGKKLQQANSHSAERGMAL